MGSAQKFECWKSSQADSDNCERVAEGVPGGVLHQGKHVEKQVHQEGESQPSSPEGEEGCRPCCETTSCSTPSSRSSNCSSLPTPEKERRSSATSSLQVSPVKDDTREEAGDEQVAKEEADGERWAGEVPKDYNEYANYSEWFWEHDVKRRDEARKLMGETDRCCFCDYECPPPTQLEDESRIMGNLMSLYDHIELSQSPCGPSMNGVSQI